MEVRAGVGCFDQRRGVECAVAEAPARSARRSAKASVGRVKLPHEIARLIRLSRNPYVEVGVEPCRYGRASPRMAECAFAYAQVSEDQSAPDRDFRFQLYGSRASYDRVGPAPRGFLECF